MSGVYEAACKLLARRDHAIDELRQKLLQKNFKPDAVSETVARLITEGHLSDERFAALYARYRAERGFGPVRISGELRERGVHDEIVHAALSSFEELWVVRAEHVRAKRFGKSLPHDYVSRMKQMKFLQYRGFLTDHIKIIIKESE